MFNLKNKLGLGNLKEEQKEIFENNTVNGFRTYEKEEFWYSATYPASKGNENIFDYSQNH